MKEEKKKTRKKTAKLKKKRPNVCKVSTPPIEDPVKLKDSKTLVVNQVKLVELPNGCAPRKVGLLNYNKVQLPNIHNEKLSAKKRNLESADNIEILEEPSDELALKLKQLDKRQRIDLYKKSLAQKPEASTMLEAYNLINTTLIEVEDKYGPKSQDKIFFHSKKYGKMFPLPKEKITLNKETGKHELITVGFLIIISDDGAFEFWSKSLTPSKIFSKIGSVVNKEN